MISKARHRLRLLTLAIFGLALVLAILVVGQPFDAGGNLVQEAFPFPSSPGIAPTELARTVDASHRESPNAKRSVDEHLQKLFDTITEAPDPEIRGERATLMLRLMPKTPGNSPGNLLLQITGHPHLEPVSDSSAEGEDSPSFFEYRCSTNNSLPRWTRALAIRNVFETKVEIPAREQIHLQFFAVSKGNEFPVKASTSCSPLGPGESRKVDIELGPVRESRRRIRVIHSVSGEPLPGVRIEQADVATPWNSDALPFETVGHTDDRGMVDVITRSDCVYSSFQAFQEGFIPGSGSLQREGMSIESEQPLELVMVPSASLRVLLRRGDAPVDGARIEWREKSRHLSYYSDGSRAPVQKERTVTDASGTAMVRGIQPETAGLLDLEVDGIQVPSYAVEPIAAGCESTLSMDLSSLARLEVSVRDTRGQPRARTPISIHMGGTWERERFSRNLEYSNSITLTRETNAAGSIPPLLIPAGTALVGIDLTPSPGSGPTKGSHLLLLEAGQTSRLELRVPTKVSGSILLRLPADRPASPERVTISVVDPFGFAKCIPLTDLVRADSQRTSFTVPIEVDSPGRYQLSASMLAKRDSSASEEGVKGNSWVSSVVAWEAGTALGSLTLEERTYFVANAVEEGGAAVEFAVFPYDGENVSSFVLDALQTLDFELRCKAAVPKSTKNLLMADSFGRSAVVTNPRLSADPTDGAQSITLGPAAKLLLRPGSTKHPTAYAIAFEHRRFTAGLIDPGKRKRISVPAGRLEVQAWSPAVGYFERSIVTTAHETTELWISND